MVRSAISGGRTWPSIPRKRYRIAVLGARYSGKTTLINSWCGEWVADEADPGRTQSPKFYEKTKLITEGLRVTLTKLVDVSGSIDAWPTWVLSNHDNPRVLSTFGDDSPAMRVPSAKLLETMILTLRGTPFLYEGDELGMTNYPFKKLADYRDVAVENAYKAKVETGKISAAAFLADQAKLTRDNARTPMQWDSSPEAGFTTGTHPWLVVNRNYRQINAAQEESGSNSVLNYVRTLIKLRAHTLAFVYGDYQDLDPQNDQIYAYTRTLGENRYLVIENFSSSPVTYTLPNGLKAATLLLSDIPASREENASTLNLAPWESRIYKQ